ncbi:hypothetical protein B0H63DRAFT_318719 [Podospora didyma]|uniref:Zn(2)-C6 fungal-type domain-containing protein n=1 Tax=Podospora didyma TaxID=330526 RepID=A0AAE0K6Z5_9PEZI|nr:hypothetical protein B0H63DRAFT_318719 [Podospora didyma]
MADTSRAADERATDSGAPKLRSTCDRCTMLKVRCDKQKPRCERCEAANAPCVYGPYRWKGRAAAAPSASRRSRSGSVSPSTLSRTPTESSSSSNNPFTAASARSRASSSNDLWESTIISTNQTNNNNNIPFNFAAPMDFQDASMGLDWDGLMPSVDTADLDSWYARFMDVDQGGSVAREDADMETDEGGFNFDGGSSSHSLSRVGSASDFASAASTSATTNRSTSPNSSRQDSTAGTCQCSTLVFNVLQDMYTAEFRCRLDDGSNTNTSTTPSNASNRTSAPRSDQMVKINRAAVAHMEQLLSCECCACARDPTLLFLVTALSSKLLAWYRSVFSVVTRQQSSLSPLDPSLGGMDDMLDLGFVTPIQVGDFHLDFGSMQRMKAQFLLCEVQKLGQVLDLFGARGIQSGMQLDAENLPQNRGTRKLPISAVHTFLTASLNQLTTAMKEYCVS